MSTPSSVEDSSKSSASTSYSSISSSSYTTSVSSLPTDASDTTLTTESSMMLQWAEDVEVHSITPPERRSNNSVSRHERRISRESKQADRARHKTHHRTRSRPHSCKRARSHETYREREFSQSFESSCIIHSLTLTPCDVTLSPGFLSDNHFLRCSGLWFGLHGSSFCSRRACFWQIWLRPCVAIKRFILPL